MLSLRSTCLLAALTLCASQAAASGIPLASLCTVPACIPVVGSTGGTVDPAGEFSMTMRNVSNNPIVAGDIQVDFSNCADVGLGGAASQTYAGETVDCVTHQIRSQTGLDGTVHLRIAGGGTGSASTSAGGCARVYCKGVLVATLPVRIYDLDGTGGVGANDLSLWLDDRFGAGYTARADYDCNGQLGAGDLSLWLTVFEGGGSTTSAVACVP